VLRGGGLRGNPKLNSPNNNHLVNIDFFPTHSIVHHYSQMCTITAAIATGELLLTTMLTCKNKEE